MIITFRNDLVGAMSPAQQDAIQQCCPAVLLPWSDPARRSDPSGTVWVIFAHGDITESMCAQMELVGQSFGWASPEGMQFFSDPSLLSDWLPWPQQDW